MVFINYGWYVQEGKEKEELWIPALSMHRASPRQKGCMRSQYILFFYPFLLVHVVIKLAPKDIYCQKNSYGRS